MAQASTTGPANLTPRPACEIRSARAQVGATQRQFAASLGVDVETYRTWDSGRQPPPPEMLARARTLVRTRHVNQLMNLETLGDLLDIHPRTLRDAARTGRLAVTYDTRTFCGRPIARASRQAGDLVKTTFYRKHAWWRPSATPPAKWPAVPRNYHSRLIGLRLHLRLSQAQLAQRLGAANKAVVYQWESRRRQPSPVFWQRVEELERDIDRDLHLDSLDVSNNPTQETR